MVPNIIAVVVAAVVAVIVGGVWYSPFLFGKAWMEALGKNPADMKGMKMPMKSMGIQFVASFVTAYVLAHFALVWHIQTFGEAVKIGFLVWAGFYATSLMGPVLWEGRPWKLYFINAAQFLVSIVLMTAIVGLWQ
ncbi:DUF1761 domain-containing protein [Candidatus Azambacteria bacterium]|nr:DUF1761 domain-containing protein [Candidatus Azambacteria bacterium]